jgi:NapH/MauN family ferredoxin-type protein
MNQLPQTPFLRPDRGDVRPRGEAARERSPTARRRSISSSAPPTRSACSRRCAHEHAEGAHLAQPPLGGADHRQPVVHLSFWLDIQILEGALTASRFIGFHLIDLNSALQVMLAHKHIIVNLVIGTGTVLVLWLLLGGRTFCSWVCPYHLLAEWAEKHPPLAGEEEAGHDQAIDRRLRTGSWLVFAAACGRHRLHRVRVDFAHRHPFPRADLRPGLALLWVLALLVFEVFFSRRAWCRYACPIGLTYGVVGIFSPVRVKYTLEELLPRGRLPQGLPGAACARHRDQGPRGRCRSAARPGLHPLRPVRRHLPDRLAQVRGQGLSKLRQLLNHPPDARPLSRSVARRVPLMIRFDNVAKSFRKSRVLDAINLEIGPAERVALIGSNGAGKTTLIRCLLGEYTFDGKVTIDGRDPAPGAHRGAGPIGFVPQLPPPLKMPVAQLIDFSAALCGTDPAEDPRTGSAPGPRPRTILARPFVKLSGGMKQKLLIAIALGRDARVLILDEPAANLDPQARKMFFELLAERQEDATMLISSHRLNEVARRW